MQGTESQTQNLALQEERILQSVLNWNQGWAEKDVEKATKDYAAKTDWTNAFGDRVRSKEELKSLLSEIFAMDFVMSGKDNYTNEKVEFLSSEVAILRSTNIRTGQKWADGSPMSDRRIHHLRVYRLMDGNWQIVSHMINQANDRD